MTTAAGRNALRAIRRCTCGSFLLLITRPPLSLVPFVCAVHVLWTSNAGRAGAHPYRTCTRQPLTPVTSHLSPDPYLLLNTCNLLALPNPSDHARGADQC